MDLFLGILIFSFFITSILIIPFIDTLYRLKFQRRKQNTKDAFGKSTPIFNNFHNIKKKLGVPVGGGLLVIFVVSVLFSVLLPILNVMGIKITHVYPISTEVNLLFFTFLSFGLLGIYDDIKKFFGFQKEAFFGMKLKHKFIIQWALAFVIAAVLYFQLGINFIYIPFFGITYLNLLYIPFAAFTIVSFANAVNITDGLDGLSSGILMISLFGLWFLSNSILDTPLSLFIALWIGSLIAFLYFNIFPARLWMGDVGALAFGATLAVIGLLLGKIVAVSVIGGIFVIEILSSMLQLLSKRFRHKKIFPVSPLHLWLQLKGWEEPKIVQRMWIASLILMLFGVWLAVI
ncbi:MAG: phospho-N-acetylmuramoyl-pentapeptide-transferase [Patescibacteria group bacterium]